eukprot:TRINITY_DN38452_c0_g1_i2.p1 TRINITY_DN38452_c0_g1~~TRINITY_DN38452_c0_g1_i2.p1  ORF type:complete len:219 (-),score=2.63 TRINITY_DN38452_c0_g1_i2:268-924(-)
MRKPYRTQRGSMLINLVAGPAKPAQHRPMREAAGRSVGNEDLVGAMTAVASHRDRSAFGLLFDHFAPRLNAYLRRQGTDPEIADELVQEAMLQVWRRAESYDPRQASVATWVFTIARNKRIDFLRREVRPELDPEDPMLVPEAPSDGEVNYQREQRRKRIGEAIDDLPREQAYLLSLAFFDDMSHSDIAKETRLPLGTVKSRLRLALARLRSVLAEQV